MKDCADCDSWRAAWRARNRADEERDRKARELAAACAEALEELEARHLQDVRRLAPRDVRAAVKAAERATKVGELRARLCAQA